MMARGGMLGLAAEHHEAVLDSGLVTDHVEVEGGQQAPAPLILLLLPESKQG